ncbi:hypothetical protein ACB092_04G029700 [Castanea dentata]
MGKQLSVILWLIVIHLLFSTGYGDYGRTPAGTGSSSGGFNSEEASRDAYAALKSNRFPDSSAVSHSEVPGLESGSRRLSLSRGALDVVAYEIRSSLWDITDSEVPDLESGSRRWSTPAAGTSSQVIGLESGRERARSSNQRLIELGFEILLGSTTAAVSIGVGELSSRNRIILNCVLVISVVGFVSLAAAFMTLSSTPSTDTNTTQTANTILARLGFAASAFGFIFVIAMGLPDNLLWVIVLALIALVFIFVKTSLDLRPRI